MIIFSIFEGVLVNEKEFKSLISKVDDWILEGALHVNRDLSGLTPTQTTILSDIMKSKGVIRVEINYDKSHLYLESHWKNIFSLLNNAHIFSLLIYNDKFYLCESEGFVLSLGRSTIIDLCFTICKLQKMNFDPWKSFISKILKVSNLKRFGLIRHSCFSRTFKQNYLEFFLEKLTENTTLDVLDLTGNDLNSIPRKRYKMVLSYFSKLNVRKLILDQNGLLGLSVSKLVLLFESLKESSISSLSLQTDQLFYNKPEQWNAIFEGIKLANITELDIRDKCYPIKIDKYQWDAFITGLRKSGLLKLHYYRAQFSPDKARAVEKVLLENNGIYKTGSEVKARRSMRIPKTKKPRKRTVTFFEGVDENKPPILRRSSRKRLRKSKTPEVYKSSDSNAFELVLKPVTPS